MRDYHPQLQFERQKINLSYVCLSFLESIGFPGKEIL